MKKAPAFHAEAFVDPIGAVSNLFIDDIKKLIEY
jgi:hypothetical protein